MTEILMVGQIHDSRELIIEQLRDLRVRVNEILFCNPTEQQLHDMMDGLMALHGATKGVAKYHNAEDMVTVMFTAR
jgi:hypothetical protein